MAEVVLAVLAGLHLAPLEVPATAAIRELARIPKDTDKMRDVPAALFANGRYKIHRDEIGGQGIAVLVEVV